QSKQSGYYLQVANTGAWTLAKKDTAGTATTLASGTATAPGTGTWHTLSLSFAGSSITAKLDAGTLRKVTDSTYTAGQIGFGVVRSQPDQFDNPAVTATSGATGTGPITSGLAGKCLAAANNGTADGTPVVLSTCDSSASGQQWTVSGDTISNAG